MSEPRPADKPLEPAAPPAPIDLTRVRTVPLDQRPSLVEVRSFAKPTLPSRDFAALLDSIPHVHAGVLFRELVDAIVEARGRGAPVVLGFGAHVIKVGLAPLLIDLIERGVITALATNGAGIIHDFEIATVGRSSEDVGAGLEDGSFGMAKETAEAINGAAADAHARGIGLGRAIGDRILRAGAKGAPFLHLSVSAACAKRNVPLTVHVAVGADIVHMHPGCDGAALGAATLADFRLLAAVLAGLGGGVYLNVGSAVVLPEVFMKALNLARNVGHAISGFTTANLDQIRHYRPRVNVLNRPGGRAIELVGHHELLLPLLRLAVLERLGAVAPQKKDDA